MFNYDGIVILLDGRKELQARATVLFTHHGNFYRMHACASAKKVDWGAAEAGADPVAAAIMTVSPGSGSGNFGVIAAVFIYDVTFLTWNGSWIGCRTANLCP